MRTKSLFFIVSLAMALLVCCCTAPVWAAPFTDNGNGTVTDHKTGLIWQKGEPGYMTWQSALNYCENLNLANNSDWRLPNIKELESLTDDTRYNPAIDTNFFPNAHASNYWSSATFAANPRNAWYVNFGYGYVDYSYKGSYVYYYYCVRCVRAGQVGSFYNLAISKAGTGTGTVTSNPEGIDCGSACDTDFAENTVVTLTATPALGSTFAGWSGDADCSDGVVTMNANKTCTATFTAMQANGPDLTGQWQSLTEQRFKGLRTRSGYLLRGALKISNIGNRDANGQFRVSYYLSNDGTTLGTPVGSTNVCVSLSRTSRTCQLKPATSVTLSFSYASTQSLKGNYVIAVIDEANNISETNENNNRASAQIQ